MKNEKLYTWDEVETIALLTQHFQETPLWGDEKEVTWLPEQGHFVLDLVGKTLWVVELNGNPNTLWWKTIDGILGEEYTTEICVPEEK